PLPAHAPARCFICSPAPTRAAYPLSLHDALPIWTSSSCWTPSPAWAAPTTTPRRRRAASCPAASTPTRCTRRSDSSARRATSRRSEEHTSELQSRFDLVCRLLLEKKQQKYQTRDR